MYARNLHEWHGGATKEQDGEYDNDEGRRDDDLSRLVRFQVQV